MHVKLTQWNKMGDHPLVSAEHCKEFEFMECAREGCGFINNFTIVHPNDYIVEINDVYVAVIGPVRAKEIMGDELPSKPAQIIRQTVKS